jgi:rRNA maturation RNase YbeY
LRKVRKDLATAAEGLGLETSEVSILFTGSAKMKSLNREYRGIPKETDVLSFPMGAPPRCMTVSARRLPVMLGDIVISIPKAVAQSREYGVTFQNELRRLLIHGLLHLAGYDHELNRYQKARMQKKEKELLSAVQAMD